MLFENNIDILLYIIEDIYYRIIFVILILNFLAKIFSITIFLIFIYPMIQLPYKLNLLVAKYI